MIRRWTVSLLCAIIMISVTYGRGSTVSPHSAPIKTTNSLAPSRLNSASIKKVWQKMGAVDDFNALEPFKKRLKSVHYFDPDHKIRYCQIQKNMSTMMMTLLCDLFSRERSDNGKVNPRCYREAGKLLRKRSSWTNIPVWQPFEGNAKYQKDSTNFVIIRDPMDRFVSAYEHICKFEKYCTDEGKNVHTFVRALHRFLEDGKPFKRLDKPEQMEHIEYHFAPQNWYCHVGDPEDEDRIMLLRYSDDQEANIAMVDNMFEEAGMDIETRNLTLQRMRNQHTWHSGNSSNKHKWLKEIYSNPATLNLIIRIYYWDYVLLEYPLPEMQ